MNKVSSVEAGDFAKQALAAKLSSKWMDGYFENKTRLANIENPLRSQLWERKMHC